MKMIELENEAMKLDPPARARLAEVLLRSLDELSEREVEELWLDEAEGGGNMMAPQEVRRS